MKGATATRSAVEKILGEVEEGSTKEYLSIPWKEGLILNTCQI